MPREGAEIAVSYWLANRCEEDRADTTRLVRYVICCLILLALLASDVSPAVAQMIRIGVPFGGRLPQFALKDHVNIEDVQSDAKKDLLSVQQFLAEQKWDEAVEMLRRVAETSGSQIIQLTDRRYITVREYCDRQIATLPPEALLLYRQRVDDVARTWLERGVAERDATPLRDLIKNFPCSTHTDEALYALGEIELEQGRFGRAREYWERISPQLRSPEGEPLYKAMREARDEDARQQLLDVVGQPMTKLTWNAYPDTDLDLASLRARLVLVSLLEGATGRAETELEILQTLHPNAEGRIAGRTGNLVETLTSLLRSSEDWEPPVTADDWTTFAGATSRQRLARPRIRGLARPAWQHTFASVLSPKSVPGKKPLLAPTRVLGRDDRLRYHPVVSDGKVFYCDAQNIYAFDLATGQPAWASDEEAPGRIFPNAATDGDGAIAVAPFGRRTEKLGVARFTVAVHGDRLFARLGSSVTSRPSPSNTLTNYLVCLNLKKQGGLQWNYPTKKTATQFVRGNWAFEGSPVCDGERVYIAMRRSDVQPQTHVACFDAATGAMLWRRFICKADTPAHGLLDEMTHNLLTLHEGRLYCNTNMGAVAALSAKSGEVRWVYRYERAPGEYYYATPPAHFYRDLNPCIYHHGMILAAPSDCEKVMAIDAATGDLLWYSAHGGLSATHPVHLLGVANDYLIATGKNVWWIDVVTGKPHAIWPKYSRDLEEAFGRGLLSGGEIYWPTREEIIVFDQELPGIDQPQIVKRIRLARPDLVEPRFGGNLIVAEGHLLIASFDKLYVYRLETTAAAEENQTAVGPSVKQTTPASPRLTKN